MSIPFFAGVPYKLKQIKDLLDGVTFGNLDITVSSRMAATDGATKADGWDSTLASKLDTNVDATISSVNTKIDQVLEAPVSLISPGAVTIPSAAWTEVSASDTPAPFTTRYSYGGGSYGTALNETGRGFVSFIAMFFNNTGLSSRTVGARITLDGSTGNAFNNISYSVIAGTQACLMFHGLGGCSFDNTDLKNWTMGVPLRYLSSLKIETYTSNADTDAYVFYCYTPTS